MLVLPAKGHGHQRSPLLDKVAQAAQATKAAGSDNENRRRLMEFIVEHPGLNIQELADSLRLQRTAARYHIRRMVRASLVVARKQGHEVLHFPPGLAESQRRVLGVLRIESVRLVALALQDTPRASWPELAQRLQTTSRTIRRAVRLLKDEDLLRVEKDGKGRIAQLHPSLRLVLARWRPNGAHLRPPSPDETARTRDGNNPLM